MRHIVHIHGMIRPALIKNSAWTISCVAIEVKWVTVIDCILMTMNGCIMRICEIERRYLVREHRVALYKHVRWRNRLRALTKEVGCHLFRKDIDHQSTKRMGCQYEYAGANEQRINNPSVTVEFRLLPGKFLYGVWGRGGGYFSHPLIPFISYFLTKVVWKHRYKSNKTQKIAHGGLLTTARYGR